MLQEVLTLLTLLIVFYGPIVVARLANFVGELIATLTATIIANAVIDIIATSIATIMIATMTSAAINITSRIFVSFPDVVSDIWCSCRLACLLCDVPLLRRQFCVARGVELLVFEQYSGMWRLNRGVCLSALGCLFRGV